MKKNYLERGHVKWPLKKLLMTMNLSFLLLLVTVIQLQAASSYAQEASISLKLKNVTIEDVFKAIEEQTEFEFFYNYNQINTEKKVSVNFQKAKIYEVLDKVLKAEDLYYKIVDKRIILVKNELKSQLQLSDYADPITVKGRVISSEEGEPIPGVNIIEKGTTNGTTTDVNGEYSIVVQNDASTLLFSFIGYTSEEIAVNSQSIINVSLVSDIQQLQEVVVVGFGTQKRRDIVGSITSISAESLARTGQRNVLDALQGSAAGVRVETASSPGGSANIRIRGLNSLSAGNNPLIIVDGVPFDNLKAVDPNDIQSVEVLKDASAAAIYGSQASNGVLLITTKRGKSDGGTSFNANISYAVQNPAIKMDLMNGQQYLTYKQEVARTNGTSTAPEDILTPSEYQQYLAGAEVDAYEKMIHNNAAIYEAQLSVNGGEKTKYYVAGNYMRQDGLINTTLFERFSLRANVDMDITKSISLSNGAFIYQYNTNNVSSNDYGRGAMYRLSPYSILEGANGQYTVNPMPDDPLFGNPLGDAYYVDREDVNTGILNNTSLKISIPGVEGLAFEAKYALDLSVYKYGKYAPGTTKEGFGIAVPDSDPPQTVEGTGQRINTDSRKWYFDGLITYKREFGRHNIDFTGLYSAYSNRYQRSNLTAQGFTSNDYLWYNLEAALLPLQVQSEYSLRNLESQMLRANYNFDGRYYVTFTARRDGYSGFSEQQKYAVFPSAAIAWRINEEGFMSDVKWVNNLKLRVSYGEVGNQAINPYQTLAQLSNNAGYVFGKSKSVGYRTDGLETNLKWETTTSVNLGLDYGLFQNRLTGSLEAYQSITRDLLVKRSIPSMMGSNIIWDNSCKVMNRGYEINITGIPVKSARFAWEITANMSYNHNEILEIYGKKEDDIANRWFIGEPIGVIYSQVSDGIWQLGEEAEAAAYGAAPGHPKVKDLPGENGEIDNAINDADRTIVGETVPNILAGLSTTLSYKGITLTVNSYGTFGAQKEMQYKYLADGRFRNFNFQNYWTPENSSNSFPRPGTITGDNHSKFGSMFVYDADWIKVKNISLGYNVPAGLIKRAGMTSLNIYTSLQDYFTFTSFPFIDPETGDGIGAYPSNKQWRVGMKIGF